jgi:hypothetical protein
MGCIVVHKIAGLAEHFIQELLCLAIMYCSAAIELVGGFVTVFFTADKVHCKKGFRFSCPQPGCH